MSYVSPTAVAMTALSLQSLAAMAPATPNAVGAMQAVAVGNTTAPMLALEAFVGRPTGVLAFVGRPTAPHLHWRERFFRSSF